MKRQTVEERGNSLKNIKKQSGMSELLILYIVLFFAATIALLWLFQSFLLDDFYRAEKKRDVVNACDSLIAIDSEDDNAPTKVKALAERYGVCLEVYKMWENGSTENVFYEHTLSHCTIHNTDIRSKQTIYKAAKRDGGIFFQYFSYDNELDVFNSISESEASAENSDISMVYAKALTQTGEDYDILIVLDTVITPVSATVRTVKTQLFLFTALFAAAALIFAIVLSRRFTLPIKRLTASAADFGQGKRFDFGGGGYRELSELSEALNYASEELEKTEQLRRELIANVSHDLRTPLTMVIGYGEMMRDIPGESTPENAANIVKEAERLNLLVSDMFQLSSIRSGISAVKTERFSLTEKIRELASGYSEMLSREGFDISFEDSMQNAVIESDPTLVGQVAQNFILNAVRHTGEDKRIGIRQRIENGWVTVTVSDTGAGIPKEKLPEIWERYYKVNSSHSRVEEGSGLGLSIVKAIMERLGGHYGVDSAIGKGSVFWFALPVTDTLSCGLPK